MNSLINEPISSPKELRTRREILEIFWRKGISGSELLKENTALTDLHLQQNFAKSPDILEKMSLVALGGYGRRELFPFSDIDILLLHDPSVADDLGAVTENIFYPLWDAGLEVGHSVRTIDACLTDAEDDFFFQVAMLDARYLAGSEELFEQLMRAYQEKYINGRRREFLEEMTCHRQERHRRFGKHIYQLEPQVKESRGGLRDIQAMLWTARFVFGLKDLAAIKSAGLITETEYSQYGEAWNHLIKIRNRLHYISGRRNDRLFFEHQEEIAKAFNYKKGKGLLDVEHFMRDVYDHMRTIAITTDLFFEHADEVITKGAALKGAHSSAAKRLEPGLEIYKGRVHISHRQSVQEKPELLMKVFVQAAKRGLPIHYRTKKLINSNLDLVNDTFRSARNISKYFLKILQQEGALPVLEIMLESGFLAAYMPEFRMLKSLAQHDIYHVYTVDHHQIQTVNVLQKLAFEKKNIFQQIENPQILFLAGLIHDIGKGTGKDHAEIGAEYAVKVGLRLGLKGQEIEVLSFLVRNHLFLTDTAMHRDLEDSALIKRCADVVQSPDNLAMLYLLSIADAKATGPTVWNEWKEALLLDLYLKIGLLLDKAATETDDIQQGVDWIRQKVQDILGDKGNIDIGTLPDDYLLSFSPEAIASHVLNRQGLDENGVIIVPEKKKNHTAVLVMTCDRPGLLSKLCGVLALHNLKVMSAQIFTWPDGTVVDSLDIRPAHEGSHEETDWSAFQEDLEKAVNFRLGLEHRLNRKSLSGNRTVTKSVPQQEVKVTFDNESSLRYTIIEVCAQDRAGLLYLITRTLAYFQINIFRAKIGRRSDQVVDVFYVLDHGQNKLTDVELVEEIRKSLMFTASPGT